MRMTFIRSIAGMLLAGCSSLAAGQSFTENFDDITTLAGNGWATTNASVAVGSTGWFQGNNTAVGGPFDSFNGAANAYIGANYNNTGSVGTISNWLMTPNRTFRNGDVLTFYTRKVSPDTYADRLEVRLSTNGASTNVGSGSGVGDYSTLMLSINPNLVLGVYPTVWTQYTITLSGLPAPTSGRMAFRYFVTSAGLNGTNSDYIGIDNAVYTPYVCPAITVNGVLGGGNFGENYSAALGQTGALGTPFYAITAGALPPGMTMSQGGAFSGAPTATGTFNFTVTVSDASGCSGSQPYSITIAATAPGAPTDVAAIAGDAQAEVSWTAPSNDGGVGIDGYSVDCSDGVNSVVAPATQSPVTVNGLTNGTAYTCTVAANNSVGTGPASAPSASFTPMGDQIITFDAQPGQVYSPGGTFPIDPPATATSGLEISYGASPPEVCTVTGSTVSIVGTGLCTLTADQAGDAAWNPAQQVTQTVDIAQAMQVLTFPAQQVDTRFFEAADTFEISPTATSATPNSGAPITYSTLDTNICTVNGTTVTMVGAGLCELAADQAGDQNYTAATQAVATVTLVQPTEADLHILKTADRPTAVLGETVGYSILVGNDGPADATNVQVLDNPPLRLDAASVVWECVEAVGTACPTPATGEGVLDATLASLPEGATVRFELFGDVIPAADPADDFTSFDNTASVALPQGSGLTDPNGNNQSTASVLVQDEPIFGDGFEDD